MELGPIMCGLRGELLAADEREILQHPLIGGVILFTRNYRSIAQLSELTQVIHALRKPPLLVAVDHEGGRVQRFCTGFTRLPPAGILGQIYQQDYTLAQDLAEQWGWLMASELKAVGVDFSFAPVLDLDRKINEMIADRAIDRDPEIVSIQATLYMQGMRRAGMSAVGKHFPGHGAVTQDSHKDTPLDERAIEAIAREDMSPFRHLIKQGVAGIMTAHILFPKVDQQLVSFSSIWLKRILREQLQFSGAIFSDDIDMTAATCAGDHLARTQAALAAGCDMVLICNNQAALPTILDRLKFNRCPQSASRLQRMQGCRPQQDSGKKKKQEKIKVLAEKYSDSREV